MIDIFIDCIPPTITAQQKGVQIVPRKNAHAFTGAKKFKPRFFKKQELEAVEQQFIRWFLPRRPKARLEGPVRLEVRFIHPWTQAQLKLRMQGKLPRFLLKDTAPDTDNLLKQLKDTLQGCRYWHNDAQVAEEDVRKGWGDRTGIHVRVMAPLNDYMPPEESEAVKLLDPSVEAVL